MTADRYGIGHAENELRQAKQISPMIRKSRTFAGDKPAENRAAVPWSGGRILNSTVSLPNRASSFGLGENRSLPINIYTEMMRPMTQLSNPAEKFYG